MIIPCRGQSSLDKEDVLIAARYVELDARFGPTSLIEGPECMLDPPCGLGRPPESRCMG